MLIMWIGSLKNLEGMVIGHNVNKQNFIKQVQVIIYLVQEIPQKEMTPFYLDI